LEQQVIAYKFLRGDRRAPFTGFPWPVDEWITAGTADACRTGIHACRPADLPYWLGRQLWEIELGGEIRERARKVVAERGRLIRPVDSWTPRLLDEFVDDLLRRTRLRFGSIPTVSGYVGDIHRFRAQRRIGLAAFAAARAAEVYEGPRGYDVERARQARWLARAIN
jgi:hypothetical protein